MRIKRYAGIGLILAGIDALLVLRLLPPDLSGWKQVVVEPGQTVWSIAEKQCPDDTRYVVEAIIQRNHIRDAMQLKPGDILEVPTKAEPLWNRLVFR
ncbi:LysM peptidoglycan-binding domain-containing protein [Alicyclobacillus macrosporangiidus]|jgi:nucleoid-associated protein YgaU|uniref:LysM domain-containing protein n=1 Tax=Alicyclobacillus macrosporangiidus TaxID=392015 RepID=A0A1I7KEU7_9BACL|nr:LysM peptidoglycan-binding domain-containing protein [Alicyclobacillus macrosporangiidus]SFU95926.1 LysM domain-containing protein [Alicyclobacillus macrosporangiidus]